jgi:hypothetical protein
MDTNAYECQILEETPARVILFLRAVATNSQIRAAMHGCGYTQDEQSQGWQLLLAATGYGNNGYAVTDDDKARAAIVELDAWDEPGFRRVHAALGHLHPAQDAFVFAGLEAAAGLNAVMSVARLLDRLDALESSPDRATTRDADRAAIATLAARGIDAALRARLRAVVQTAQAAKVPVPAETVAVREKALRELRAWHKDWAETARAVVRRRDQLILMGLAKRKSPKDDADDGDGDATTGDTNAATTAPAAPATSSN